MNHDWVFFFHSHNHIFWSPASCEIWRARARCACVVCWTKCVCGTALVRENRDFLFSLPPIEIEFIAWFIWLRGSVYSVVKCICMDSFTFSEFLISSAWFTLLKCGAVENFTFNYLTDSVILLWRRYPPLVLYGNQQNFVRSEYAFEWHTSIKRMWFIELSIKSKLLAVMLQGNKLNMR